MFCSTVRLKLQRRKYKLADIPEVRCLDDTEWLIKKPLLVTYKLTLRLFWTTNCDFKTHGCADGQLEALILH
jgi:hypothetical protein